MIINTCMNRQIISIVNEKLTHILFPLFNSTADYLLMLATPKICEASTISYEWLHKMMHLPL